MTPTAQTPGLRRRQLLQSLRFFDGVPYLIRLNGVMVMVVIIGLDTNPKDYRLWATDFRSYHTPISPGKVEHLSHFLCGASQVDITPPVGLLLDGYMARTGVSVGVHDPLLAHILVLEAGGKRAAVVTLDVLAVTAAFATPLRRALADVLQTEPDAVLICASHTHAGPAGLQDWFPIGGAATLNAELIAIIQTRLVEAARQAFSQLTEARLIYNMRDVEGIGGDRNRPDQPIHSRVTALHFEASDGRPLAVAFHYACHPTVLGADNRHYSADFPGAARRRIAERYPGAVCLYFNGAAGDISTRYTRRAQTFAEVERLGALLGDQVAALLNDERRILVGAHGGAPPHSRLELVWDTLDLQLPIRDFAATPPPPTLPPAGGDRRAQTRTEGAIIQAQMSRAFTHRRAQTATLHRLRIGPWTLAGVPGEAFDALAVAVRRVNPFTLIVGYANDYLGYFPTQAAIDAQTYEALSSPYDARAHALIEAAILQPIT
jgi:hypothetical protein